MPAIAPQMSPAEAAIARAQARAFLEAQRTSRSTRWKAQPGPQAAFVESDVREILYGGQAGGGKTMALPALAMPWMRRKELLCLYLRRTTPELADLIRKAKEVYLDGKAGWFDAAAPDGAFREDKGIMQLRFGEQLGATLLFGHCEGRDDWKRYIGHEYQIICFDELTTFAEQQYTEICARLRSSAEGLPRYIRATTNPGGEGHNWVFKRWGPWLDPTFELQDWEESYFDDDGVEHVVRGRGLAERRGPDDKRLPPAESGQALYVTKVGEKERFSTEPFTWDKVDATTRTFIAAKLSDNPALLKADPNYRAQLRALGPVRRAQLERGDWTAVLSSGTLFRREWFQFVPDVPPGDVSCARAWDKAATEPGPGNQDPDWTAGVLVGAHENGMFYVWHVARARGSPGKVRALVRSNAELDGHDVLVGLVQDPGQAGKAEVVDHVAELSKLGFPVRTLREKEKKETRAIPASNLCSPESTGGLHGLVCVVRGDWNEDFIAELEAFPDGGHDDQVDAFVNALELLRGGHGTAEVGVTVIG